jgi:endoglucanase
MIPRCSLALLAIVLLTRNTPARGQDTKVAYWDSQRRGANWFNATPTREWLVAAREAGIRVVRLAPNKWESARRDFLIGDADRYEGIVDGD